MRADFIGFYERAPVLHWKFHRCIVFFLAGGGGGGGWFTFTSDWLAGFFALVLTGLMRKLGILPYDTHLKKKTFSTISQLTS